MIYIFNNATCILGSKHQSLLIAEYNAFHVFQAILVYDIPCARWFYRSAVYYYSLIFDFARPSCCDKLRSPLLVIIRLINCCGLTSRYNYYTVYIGPAQAQLTIDVHRNNSSILSRVLKREISNKIPHAQPRPTRTRVMTHIIHACVYRFQAVRFSPRALAEWRISIVITHTFVVRR